MAGVKGRRAICRTAITTAIHKYLASRAVHGDKSERMTRIGNAGRNRLGKEHDRGISSAHRPLVGSRRLIDAARRNNPQVQPVTERVPGLIRIPDGYFFGWLPIAHIKG